MKKIYYMLYLDGDMGDAVFDDRGSLVSHWCANDASWRQEYFEEFMEHAGVKITHKIPKKLRSKVSKQIKKYFQEAYGEELEGDLILFGD